MISDDEIDLTEHRDFGVHLNFFRAGGQINLNAYEQYVKALNKRFYGEIPWSVKPLEKPYPFDGLVALGNKEQRKIAIETRFWGTTKNVNCDCCGKEYIKIPWGKDAGLCRDCYNRLHSTVIIPWQS